MTQARLDRAGIEAAYQVIRPHVRRTPVIEIDAAEFGLPPAPLVLKLELMQHSGSFKARGAFANLLLRDIPAAGVSAASGGNHGAAVAFAAGRLGVPAHIFVPEVSSPAKIARIRGYGASLVVKGALYADALAACDAWTETAGALPVHAYDQDETLLGAGSMALELEEQAPDAAAVLVSVGGGGLIGGVAAYAEGRRKIIGVEPEAAPTLHMALEAGRPVDAPAGGYAADSLAPRRVGERGFALASRWGDRVVLVTDDHIREAQAALWNTLRIAAEPGGAAAMAAVLSGRRRLDPDRPTVVVLCGANTTAVDFGR